MDLPACVDLTPLEDARRTFADASDDDLPPDKVHLHCGSGQDPPFNIPSFLCSYPFLLEPTRAHFTSYKTYFCSYFVSRPSQPRARQLHHCMVNRLDFS